MGYTARVLVPSAVLFDFNGVLVDDEHLHQAGFNDVLAPLGITMTDAAYHERYLGFDDRGAFTAVLRDFGREADEALVRDLIARKAEVYKRRAATELRIYPGATDAVKRLAAECAVGIVSGALRDEIELALAVMQSRSAVGFIVAAEDVTVCKPDPEGYLAGLTQLRAAAGGEIAPRRVVAIEDSIAGIESARGAGLSVVAVSHTYARDALERAGAHVVVPVVADVTFEVLSAAIRAQE
jgi:HAD superfamily hydrolase (TIGR01509 family)